LSPNRERAAHGVAAEKQHYAAILDMLKKISHIDLLPALRIARDEGGNVRERAANPFEPTLALAERFIAYLKKAWPENCRY
jgi:hypothetical protein